MTDAPVPSMSPEERLDGFLTNLERASIPGLQMLAVRPLDADAHERAREAAAEAARDAGRADLADASRERVVSWLEQNLGAPTYQQSFLGEAASFVALRPGDRLLLAQTLGDAALACVVLDRVDDETADELIGPCADLVYGDDVTITGSDDEDPAVDDRDPGER